MLNIRYFSEFKGRPTLLFTGNPADFNSLERLLSDWNGEDRELVLIFKEVASIQGSEIKSIKLTQGGTGDVSQLSWRSGKGIWMISSRTVPKLRGIVMGLTSEESPSHAYLDIGKSDCQIICSIGEYKFDSINPM